MQTIDHIQREIIDEFDLFDTWTDKYEYLIDMGKSLPMIDAQYCTEDHLIKGCQSKVWLHAEMTDEEVVKFTADSEAVITKGIIALMIRVLSGHTPEEIAYSDLYFIDEIGLREHLSPTRSNGLVHMVKKMKMYGLAFMAKVEK